jgi:hypothetical protein
MAVVVIAAGCVESRAVPCDFGTCPASLACDEQHDRCVLPAQLDSCNGLDDSAECAAGDAPGVCVDGVCLVKGCGDLRVNGAEQCDGEQFREGADDCSDIGFYGSGAIACNADCTIDVTACEGLGFCGDGKVDVAQEACDFNAAETTATCAKLGYYVGDTASCTAFCTYKVEGTCSERCGDGAINGTEVCEPSMDVPDAVSCLDYGFDSGGLTCAGTCNPDLDRCHHFGLHTLGVTPNQTTSVWQYSPTDAFITGYLDPEHGFLWKWNGSSAIAIASPVHALYAVSGSSATNVIAVGNDGTILRYDGTTVTTMTSTVAGDLWGVQVRAAGEAYAVGDAGTVAVLNGSTWTTLVAPTIGTLYGVTATGPTDIWVVGGGGAYHYDGVDWTPHAVGGGGGLSSIWRTGADVYAVGNAGTIVHYDGVTWEVIDFGLTVPLTSIWGSGPDDILAAGYEGVLLRFDGTTWRELVPPDGSGKLTPYRLAGFDRTHALVLGDNRRVSAWEGVAWAPMVALPGGAAQLNAAWGTLDDLYVPTATTLDHYDGRTWTAVLTGTSMGSIWGLAANDIYLTEGGNIRHYDGNTLGPAMTMPSGVSVYSLRGGGGAIFAYCKGGEVLKLVGSTWTMLTTIDGASALWTFGPSDLYVTAVDTIHHFNGTTWTQTIVAGAIFADLWGASATELYAVGLNGVVARGSGTTWANVAVPTTRNLVSVHGTSTSDVFVVGEDALLHFDGSHWTPIRTGPIEATLVWAMPQEIVVLATGTTAYTAIRTCVTCL